jgi:hypothetical protein
MARTAEEGSRITDLVAQATALIKSGGLPKAAEKLKEAASIDPENAEVKSMWDRLADEDKGKELVNLCKKWESTLSDDDGEVLLDYIHKHNIDGGVAEEAMRVILDYRGDLDMADQITGALLKLSGARRVLAASLKELPTRTFGTIFERGDDSMNGTTDLLLSPPFWDSQEDRIAAERDVFQLALAQMMEAGEDFPGRAMKCMSRLLGAEASNLKGIIDADGFDVILSYLDIRLPQVLRSQATLATAKLFELSPDEAQTLISQYVVKRVKKPTADGLILAFSAAAAVFPMAPSAASNLFLSEGFLPSLVSIVGKWKSHRLEQSALELLSAACIDKNCRIGIRKTCLDWVKGVADTGTDQRASQASLILVKIKDAVPEGEKAPSADMDAEAQTALIFRFKSLILSSDSAASKQDSVEGLAYSSIAPPIKEELANDSAFLQKLVKIMGESSAGAALIYGGLSIFANLTVYAPLMSEEQKKLAQLKDYANSSKPVKEDQLNGDAHVTARCKKVLDAGAIPLFVLLSLNKKLTPASQLSVLQILNSLSKEQKHRGIIAQQGAVKLLLQIYETLSKDQPPIPQPTSSDENASTPTITLTPPAQSIDQTTLRIAAHALSRILISTNPSHVFNSSLLPMTTAIRPLTLLLTEDPTSEQRNLLPTFEALLALTNLASTDDTARDAIIRVCWPQVEDLLLSNNTLVQRASAELICNLSASPHGVAKFADGSARASNRMHILLALADVDDLATRKAAGGALAMLTEWDKAVEAILERERGVKIVLEMCKDESEEVRHRGAVCLCNLVNAPGETGAKAREVLKRDDALQVIAEMVKASKVKEVVELGIEALTVLTKS